MSQVSPPSADTSQRDACKVLEFGLGEDRYCLQINTIDEIVDAGELTPIPNSPSHVDGVMDLRGRTTTIVDPKKLFDIDEDGARSRILVFEQDAVDDESTVGWLVDDVYQVRDVPVDEVDETTIGADRGIRGVVHGDDGSLVVWLEPKIGRND